MEFVFDCVMMQDVKSPVRASVLDKNWISMPIFKQTAYRKQLPEALGCK